MGENDMPENFSAQASFFSETLPKIFRGNGSRERVKITWNSLCFLCAKIFAIPRGD